MSIGVGLWDVQVESWTAGTTPSSVLASSEETRANEILSYINSFSESQSPLKMKKPNCRRLWLETGPNLNYSE